MIKSDNNLIRAVSFNARNEIADKEFFDMLSQQGIEQYDPRLVPVRQILNSLKTDKSGVRKIDQKTLTRLLGEKRLLQQTIRKQQIIPDFSGFTATLDHIFNHVKKVRGGEVANYIPQLASVAPDLYALSICTIDGQVYSLGDHTTKFSLQSTNKPINYALALEELGEETVHRHVGKEPSGVSFNALTLNARGLPHNPLINAGAIMCSSLIQRQMAAAEKFDFILDVWQKLNGIDRPTFNNSMYLSEKSSADRNFALAYFMRENGAFPPNTNVEKVLDFYFQCCAIESNTDMLARAAATFANSGVNPFTNEKVLAPETVKKCLSMMHSCGMYDYSGEFSFRIGLPAKSGVSGAIWMVIPNLMGIAIYSPGLDECGNSLRGIKVAEELVSHFNFHHYDSLKVENAQKQDPRRKKYETKVNAVMSLVFAASAGDLDEMRRLHAVGVDLNESDYDGRTALHLAAAENQTEAVKYLLKNGAHRDPVDRWGATPLDDAKRARHKDIIALLEK